MMRTPTSNVRVAVTARMPIVTLTCLGRSRATTPVGSARATSTIFVSEKPPIGIGCVSMLVSACRSSASPSTVTIGGATVDRRDLEPACRRAGHLRLDRQGLRLAVREDRDRDMRGRRLDVDLRNRVADAVDRDELDVLVDIDARRLDHDTRSRCGDPLEHRRWADDMDLGRVDGLVAQRHRRRRRRRGRPGPGTILSPS